MQFIRKRFWYVPAIIWMIVIFRLSGQVGKVSSSLSFKVTAKIVYIIELVRRGDNADAVMIAMKLHPIIRKLAHMAEYGILYILLALSFLASTRATRAMAYAVIMSAIYAGLDEFHQSFVADRSAQVTDVCIDMAGVLMAVTFALLIYSFWQDRREKSGYR
ncbi:MAG: VanZ family protein [Lachnospiraceae bacterium]|nr:VanZ family protein [Lachnospiraceae bacterium]